ncbi:uncharacterized protein N7487_011422 [Penicillium crustosum]|uniref:uncharacterized protein n=1 Tax=Penicillium crustosum TaxID=36656 RepID=UPI00238CB764|nr:uncharacterized protein N7487_011422 [Penicillium crustosum]KAJ5393781.1 hypothetical protein N7487_011422 [Penicillium crustosum]
MFKTGCLYSAPAFFFRCGSPRSNKIGASFESEVLSHVLFFKKKKVVSGYFSERRSSFVPKIGGKTVDASGLAGEISQRAAPPSCLLPARPASLQRWLVLSLFSFITQPPSCHLFLLTYPSHYLYVRL